MRLDFLIVSLRLVKLFYSFIVFSETVSNDESLLNFSAKFVTTGVYVDYIFHSVCNSCRKAKTTVLLLRGIREVWSHRRKSLSMGSVAILSWAWTGHAPQIFGWPLLGISCFFNFPFKFVWLIYTVDKFRRAIILVALLRPFSKSLLYNNLLCFCGFEQAANLTGEMSKNHSENLECT